MENEITTLAGGGRPIARAAARMMAIRARGMLADAEKVLELAGDVEAAAVARQAGEATTALLVATHDGPSTVFACKR